MEIKKQEIHIWSGQLNTSETDLNKLTNVLSFDESERADRLVNKQHQHYFMAARGLLRNTLSKYLNIPPKDIEFDYTEHQKPIIRAEQNQDIQFNLSHSHNFLVIAICLEDKVGIDIERIQAKFNPGIVERYFTSEEQAVLAELNSQDKVAAFYQIWANKEAVIKAIGKGLFINITDISSPCLNKSSFVQVEGKKWHTTPLSVNVDYKASLAYAGNQKELLYYKL